MCAAEWDAGVTIKELAEYLGHGDPGFILRLYTHLLPSSHDRSRKAIDSRLDRLFSIAANGAVTEQATNQHLADDGQKDTDPGHELGL